MFARGGCLWLVLSVSLQIHTHLVSGQSVWSAPPPYHRFQPPGATRSTHACSGRGNITEDGRSCKCDNNFAEIPKDSTCDLNFFHRHAHGFLGDQCQVEVENVDGEPSEIKGYNLQGDQMQCYSVCFGGSLRWERIVFEIERNSDSGDPDLYGKWYYDGIDPIEALPSQPSSTDFDFNEMSSSSKIRASTEVRKSDLSLSKDVNVKGVLLCVHAYGTRAEEDAVNFTLRWDYSECPLSFHEDGQVYVCSTPRNAAARDRHGECVMGSCQCYGEYVPPVVEWFDGTGFDDCSASVGTLSEASPAEYYLEPDAWRYYELNVGELDRHVILDLHANTSSAAYGESPTLYMKYGQPPGARYQEYDKRSGYSYWQNAGPDQQVRLDESDDEYRNGTWYVGVQAGSSTACNFSLTLTKYTCPMDCSGHGTCHKNENGTYACVCHDQWLSPPDKGDCSAGSAPMEFGVPQSDLMKDTSYVYYSFPPIHPEMASRHVEIEAHITYYYASEYTWHWGMWGNNDEKPTLLLKSGNADDYPNMGDFEFHQVLEMENKTYVLTIPASKVNEGIWKAAIFNPDHSRDMRYTITMDVQAYCPNNCNADLGQGTCTKLGSCMCNSGFTGTDCGFLTNQCKVASYERKGHCLLPCQCHTTTDAGVPICQYGEQCGGCLAGYRFIEPSTNPSEACVRDECTADQIYVSEDMTFTCTKECASDGEHGGKVLRGCIFGTKKCLPPYVNTNGECQLVESPVASPPPANAVKRLESHESGLGPGMVTLVAFIMLAVGGSMGALGLYIWQQKQETGRWDGFLNARNGNISRPWTEMENDTGDFQPASFD